MKYTRQPAALLALMLVISSAMTACRGRTDTPDSTEGDGQAPTTGNASLTLEADTAPAIEPAEEPTVGVYTDEAQAVITLGSAISISGSGASATGSTVTISRAGTYLFSGMLEGGQIVVDTEDDSKVTLVLNGVSVTCANGPAILVASAPKKVVIYTAEGSVNILSDTAGYVVPDSQQTTGGIYPNACIYSCEDLEFDGKGELHVTGKADKGINSKDDVKIEGGTLVLTSVGVGIRGNDSLTVSGGYITVNAGGDGIKTANTDKEGKGWLSIEGGSLFVTAMGDGISAATDLTVSGGMVVVTTTDTDGVVLKESDGNPTSSSGGGGRPGGFGGMMGESEPDKASISAKGLKATGILTIQGGQITVAAQDDGIHSDTDLSISNGTIHIRAADDGVHAEGELTISGGVLTVAQSYEGLEGLHVTITGGTNRITASDDGANATGGEGGGFGGMGGGRPGGGWGGQSGGTANTDPAKTPALTFAGGYTVFNAAGDGIDSNGNIDITGGTVLVYGPTDSFNGPIDSGDGGYCVTISGGLLLAVGSSGMAESAENNGQAVIAAAWRSGGISAEETIGILDKNGYVLAAFKLPKAIQSMVFSSSAVVAGETYTIVSGGTTTADTVDGVIDPATYTGYEVLGTVRAS